MRQRDFAIQIEDDPNVPLFRRLAKAIEDAVHQGRLKPGEMLPGTRLFAERIGINRRTVQAALEELESLGWVVMEPNRGTFVANPLPAETALRPDAATPPGALSPVPGFDLPSRLSPISAVDTEALTLSDGFPDASLFPSAELARAYQRALLRHSDELLQYGEPMGNRLLRETLAKWVSERRGLAIAPEQILITRGSRSALTLVSLALLKEGNSVGVEDPGSRPAWETMLHCAKVHLVPLPVDGEGLVVEALEERLRTTKLRLLYLTPQRQFPTTVTLSPHRRARLLKLAAEHRVAILEDDYDADYYFGETSVLPLASQDASQVIYMSSLSRLIAPGLRLGFVVAPSVLVERLARLQRSLEWQGDRVLEWAVADLIRDEELSRHLRKARRIYQARRDHLVAELNRQVGQHVDLRVPGGGLALWMEGKAGIDMEAWVAAARRRGLILNPPSHYALTDARPCARIGFGQVAEPVLTEAVSRLAKAVGDLNLPR